MKISNLAIELFSVKNSISNSISIESNQKEHNFRNIFRGEICSTQDTLCMEGNVDYFIKEEALTNEELLLIVKFLRSFNLEEIKEEDMAIFLIQFLNQLIEPYPVLNDFEDMHENTITDQTIKLVTEIINRYSTFESGIQENDFLQSADKDFIETILPTVAKLKEEITKAEFSLKTESKAESSIVAEGQLLVARNYLLEPKEKINTNFLKDNLLFYRKSTKLPVQETRDIRFEGNLEKIINGDDEGIFTLQNSLELQGNPIIGTQETNFANILKTINLDLKEKFMILKEGETTTSTIKLYPEELGEVNVLLKLNQEQGVLTIRIVAGNEQAFNHLNEQGKELQQRFENASFSEVNVEFLMDSGNGDKEKDSYQGFEKKFKLSEQESEEEFEYKDLVNSTYNYKV